MIVSAGTIDPTSCVGATETTSYAGSAGATCSTGRPATTHSTAGSGRICADRVRAWARRPPVSADVAPARLSSSGVRSTGRYGGPDDARGDAHGDAGEAGG